MTRIAFGRQPPLQDVGSIDVEVDDTAPVKVIILSDSDKSDPLNNFLVVGFRVGDFWGRATVEQRGDPNEIGEAIAALLLGVAEHAAEFRDAVAVARAKK